MAEILLAAKANVDAKDNVTFHSVLYFADDCVHTEWNYAAARGCVNGPMRSGSVANQSWIESECH